MDDGENLGMGVPIPKRPPETEEDIKKLLDALKELGCVEPTWDETLPKEIEGDRFFTQIEIPNIGKRGVLLAKGLWYAPYEISRFVDVFHFEDWHFGKEGKKPYWTRYHRGN